MNSDPDPKHTTHDNGHVADLGRAGKKKQIEMLRRLTAIMAGVLAVSAMSTAVIAADEEAKMPTQTVTERRLPNSSFEKEEGIALPGFDDALADSLTGFGDRQGARGWRYGYLRAKDRRRKLDRPGLPGNVLQFGRGAIGPVPAS